jgi:hypothetical protein
MDVDEKLVQIPLMREIYASAIRVLSWLGPSFRGVVEAYSFLPQLAMLGIERHPTGKPDTETVEGFMKSRMKVLPEDGNILRSKGGMLFLSHDRDLIIMQSLVTRENFRTDFLLGPGNDEIYAAIDRLFSSSYFQRSWIVQEVAVTEAVFIICGQYQIHWDVFRIAYEGRMFLLLQRPPLNLGMIRHIPMIRDARIRHRRFEDPNCFDLGIALDSFTYTKEEIHHDRIYAAPGIVRPQSSVTNIVPDYTKSVEDVFYEVSCHIICERQDLFLWGTKSLLSKRTMKALPTWVPEWTMKANEEAIEFANPRLSKALPGKFEISGRSLFLDGHILDEISITIKINKLNDIVAIFTIIQVWFVQQHRILLHTYGSNTHGLVHDELFDERGATSDIAQVLAEFTNMPTCVKQLLKSANVSDDAPCQLMNPEAL